MTASYDSKERREDGPKGFMYAAIVVTLLIICCAESVAFSIFNKWLFSGPLRTPIFVTGTHQVMCFLGALIVWLLAPASFYTRTKVTSGAVWTKIMLIPVGFIMNIGLNNLSLKFTTLALNQLIRSFSPVSIAITSYLIEGKTQSWQKTASLCMLVGGVVMGVMTSPDFEMLGFLICGGSVLGQSLGIVMTAFVMGDAKVRLAVFDVLLYATLPATIVLFPWAFGMGEFAVLEKSIQKEGFGVIMGLILAGGCLSFTYNLFCTVFIKLTSSVYYGVTGGFRCALAIVLSYMIFPQKASTLSIIGICIAMASFIANSYFTMREKLDEQKRKTESIEVDQEKEGLLNGNDRSSSRGTLGQRKKIVA